MKRAHEMAGSTHAVVRCKLKFNPPQQPLLLLLKKCPHRPQGATRMLLLLLVSWAYQCVLPPMRPPIAHASAVTSAWLGRFCLRTPRRIFLPLPCSSCHVLRTHAPTIALALAMLKPRRHASVASATVHAAVY